MYNDILTSSEKISQKAIKELEEIRTQISTLKEQKKSIEDEIDMLNDTENSLNKMLADALESNILVSPGKYKLALIIKKLMPRISWKSVVINFKGSDFAESLMDARIPEYTKKVIIEV